MNWKALRDELAVSAYLSPEDDISTQRGIVATAMAILGRMSNETRETSWRPYRLLKAAEKPVPSAAPAEGGTPGNAPVRAPCIPPRGPAPRGAAIQPQDAFAIGG